MTSLLPTSDRPEPVLDAAKLAAAVSGVVLSIGTVFVLVGWVTADDVQNWAVIAGGIVMSIGTLLAVVLPIITAIGARAQVTPLAAPVSVDGAPLAPAGAPPTAKPAADRELVDELRDLEQADARRPQPVGPPTVPVSAIGAWTPATPAASAAEPTPIEAEAAAATTGRTTAISTTTA